MLWTIFLLVVRILLDRLDFLVGPPPPGALQRPLIGSFSWVALGVCCRFRLVVLLALWWWCHVVVLGVLTANRF